MILVFLEPLQIFCLALPRPAATATTSLSCLTKERKKKAAQSDTQYRGPNEFKPLSCKFELIYIVGLLSKGERLNSGMTNSVSVQEQEGRKLRDSDGKRR